MVLYRFFIQQLEREREAIKGVCGMKSLSRFGQPLNVLPVVMQRFTVFVLLQSSGLGRKATGFTSFQRGSNRHHAGLDEKQYYPILRLERFLGPQHVPGYIRAASPKLAWARVHVILIAATQAPLLAISDATSAFIRCWQRQVPIPFPFPRFAPVKSIHAILVVDVSW